MKTRNARKEKKKKPGVFGEKKRRNKERRKYMIALMVGGKEWADKCVRDGRITYDPSSSLNSREQHYGVNSNCDKNRVLLQLGDGMEQVRVQLTADEVDQLITHLQHRRDEIRQKN